MSNSIRRTCYEKETCDKRFCFNGDFPVSYTHLDVYKRQDQRVLLGLFTVSFEKFSKSAEYTLDMLG